MTRLAPLFLVLLAACPSGGGSATVVATTGPGPVGPPPPAHVYTPPKFDATGWVLLGSQEVNGRIDRDVFHVNKHARWDRLMMVVYDSDLELVDFVVHFNNGERWEPKTKHFFRENERTRVIDLPGDDRHISEIDLVYKNVPGGGRARVEIYGKDVKAVQPPPPPPPPIEFEPTGWTLLGSQTVEGKRDRDVYKIDPKPRYDKLMLVVKEGDLEMDDFVVHFRNKDKWEPKMRHSFKEGSRSKAIDLPGADRHITEIVVKYGNRAGGGRARLEIYGKDTNEGRKPGQP